VRVFISRYRFGRWIGLMNVDILLCTLYGAWVYTPRSNRGVQRERSAVDWVWFSGGRLEAAMLAIVGRGSNRVVVKRVMQPISCRYRRTRGQQGPDAMDREEQHAWARAGRRRARGTG
jgi:hypothetical protein